MRNYTATQPNLQTPFNGVMRDDTNTQSHAAWHLHAKALATWVWQRWVNRTDVWGGYIDEQDRAKIVTHANGIEGPLGSTTTKPSRNNRGTVILTEQVLEKHFLASSSRHVVGLHTTSADNLSRWGAVEIDAHDEMASADTNLKAALVWFARLQALGLSPLLMDSNGKGGFHLRVLFTEAVRTEIVFHFFRWLVSDFSALGFDKRPETFPKQESIPPKGYGNWLRLPGKHHTLEQWTRVWDGERFLEQEDAVRFLLAFAGDSPTLIPEIGLLRPELQPEQEDAAEYEQESASNFGRVPSPPRESPERTREVMVEAVKHVLNNDSVPYEDSGKEPSYLAMMMAVHSVDPSEAGFGVFDEWSARCPAKHNAKGSNRVKWASLGTSTGLKIGIGSLIMWAQKSPAFRDWLQRRSVSTSIAKKDAVAPSVDLQGLRLVVAEARKTKTKIVATVTVERDGVPIDSLSISSASTSRRDAAKEIAKHLAGPDAVKIDMALASVMTMARELAGKRTAREGATVKEIIAGVITQDLQPVYKTPAGSIFCELRGEQRRQDFLGNTSSRLIDAAAKACDAPTREDGTVNRPALLKAVKVELEILFADLMATLPTAINASLQENSAAAREFQNALTRILTTPGTWETGAYGACNRASLISRAAIDVKKPITNMNRWRRVLSAVNLWWRPVTLPDGEIIRLFAIRWELAHQIKIPLFGVVDQDSLTTLGVRYGVIDPNPPVFPKTEHGSIRIAVLKRAFIEPLLADAEERFDGQ